LNSIVIPDGNKILEDDMPAIAGLIERNSMWVDPITFRKLQVWYPHVARGRPLYDASWANPYTNTRRATGSTAAKFEGNVAASNALMAALGASIPQLQMKPTKSAQVGCLHFIDRYVRARTDLVSPRRGWHLLQLASRVRF
jgi:hypothetical protein